MGLNINSEIQSKLSKFPINSNVWVYQCEKELSKEIAQEMNAAVQQFAANWKVHGQLANALGTVLFNRFIVFIVDAQTPASGCSIDASVEFVKQLGSRYAVDFFNRTTICYVLPSEETIQQLPLKIMREQLQQEIIPVTAQFFNNTITSLDSFLNGEWFTPILGTWLQPKQLATPNQS